MTRLGMIKMVTAVRISSSNATVGVAIIGNPNPVVPLTKAAISKEKPTKIVVESKGILSEKFTQSRAIEHDSVSQKLPAIYRLG
jgi:hypothetical protein